MCALLGRVPGQCSELRVGEKRANKEALQAKRVEASSAKREEKAAAKKAANTARLVGAASAKALSEEARRQACL